MLTFIFNYFQLKKKCPNISKNLPRLLKIKITHV